MNILAINILWSLGLTSALFWRVSALLGILQSKQPWAAFLRWTLALTIFKQLMALFFYTAETAAIAQVFYILLLVSTAFFFPIAFETVLRFVGRPSGRLAKVGIIGVVLTVVGACFWGIEGMVLRQPKGVDAYIFDADLAPWAGALLAGWTLFYGVVTWLALRPIAAPANRPFLPVVYGYGINLLIIIHDAQVASGVLETPFLSGFGNVVLAVTFVISAELTVTRELQRTAASDRQALAELDSRRRFLDGVSKELQGPMEEIEDLRGRLQAESLDEDSRRLVGLIKTSSDLLHGTLEQLVDFERLNRGDFILRDELIELESLLNDILQQGRELTLAEGLQFRGDVDVSEGLVVRGDAQRLRQVLTYLIANAVKFTLEGSVMFRCRAYRMPDASQITLRFEIEDTGVGIAANDQARIFTAFAQADEGIERRFQGVGLGLALCEKLVGEMGGEIQLDSQVAKGTRIQVDIRLEEALTPQSNDSLGPR
ncbi:MAG: hypothetical protein CMH55_05730 [Myxococcales bacterium]|nr:hypothetical protein [Myxococcales bacterium]